MLPHEKWMRNPLAVSLALLIAAPVCAQGKFPPDALKNVQAMPEGTTVKQVVEAMRGFTRALGVRCTYCHVGTEGQPLEAIDFAADTKAAKKNARMMLRMTQAINGEQLPQMVERVEPDVAVLARLATAGSPAARPDRRGPASPTARVEWTPPPPASASSGSADYGRGGYDFGDVSLSEAANIVHERRGHRRRDQAARAQRRAAPRLLVRLLAARRDAGRCRTDRERRSRRSSGRSRSSRAPISWSGSRRSRRRRLSRRRPTRPSPDAGPASRRVAECVDLAPHARPGGDPSRRLQRRGLRLRAHAARGLARGAGGLSGAESRRS